MYYWLTLALVTLSFLFQLFLSVLDMKSKDRPIPDNLSGLYDEEHYRKWRSYKAEKDGISLWKTVAGYVLTMVLLASGSFSLIASLTDSLHLQNLFVILLYLGVSTLVSIFFDYYETMHIEARYDFNRSTVKTFFGDQLKSFLIEFVLVYGLVTLYTVLYETFGVWALILFAAAVIVLITLISLFAPKLTLVFNKRTPLEEGELRTKLEKLLRDNDYEVRAIDVIDASKRSTKANASFSGMGRMKTITLYDTLLEQLTPDEIVAVFAHELGHGKHRDILKNSLKSYGMILCYVGFSYLVTVTTGFFTDFRFENVNYAFGMIVLFEAVLSVFSPLFSLVTNFFSRRDEYAADSFAKEQGYAEGLISGLKKLTCNTLSDLNPHPLLIRLYYSHPTLSQRIDNLK